MRIISTVQGSPEWLAVRANRHTASEAAAIFGQHKYMSRDDLLKQKATGEVPEVSGAQQVIFNRGHDAEAKARPIAEGIIGEELFPCTVEDDEGRLLASMDGLTMLADTGWECKLYNQNLAERVGNDDLEDHYKWQMDQQMAVTGAEKILFMCTDGTDEKTVWLWYQRDEKRIARLIAGWNQFEKDLANYVPVVDQAKPEPDPIEAFPALSVVLVGEVKNSTLPAFKGKAMAFIDSINTDLQTDDDFANAENAVKFCEKAEKEIDLVKSQALSQTRSIDELFREMDHIKELLRQKRLMLDKLVKARKESLKNEIIAEARDLLMADMAKANEEFRPVVIQGVTADFAGAAKNKRTFASLRSAVNDELSRVRIALSERRDHIRASIKLINDAGADYKFLFSDIQQLVDRPHDYLQMVIDKRVNDHKAAEQKRIDELAAKKAEQLAAEQRRKDQEEADRVAREQRAARQAELEQQIAEQEQSIQEGIALAREKNAVAPDLLDEVSATVVDLAASVRPDTKAPEAILRPAPAARKPTDDEIIEALAVHFGVNEFKVIDWLLNMNLGAASQRVAVNR